MQVEAVGSKRVTEFILREAFLPTIMSEGRWKKALTKLLVPSNVDDCRDDFLLGISSSLLISPIFEYSACLTPEIRAQQLAKKLRTPSNACLLQAQEVLKRAVELYGAGNILHASDPPQDSLTTATTTATATTTITATTIAAATAAATATTPTPPAYLRTGTTFPTTRSLNRKDALKYLRGYLSSNRLDGGCTVKFSDGLPSIGLFINRPRATMARVRCEDAYFGGDDDCKHSLLVSDKLLSNEGDTVNAIRLVSFAVHEIGTHLVRRTNEEIQPWLRKTDRYEMVKDPRLVKATEEGLAMIHEAMHLPSMLLARSALYYVASARAQDLSFVDLFAELEQWVVDPVQRFDVSFLFFF